ncbi:hypothetical protein pb186bvf_018907 [Paramecium bursaria]
MQCAEQCKFLYECIEGICQHKNFWPPTFIELIGILLTGVFSGFASLAGIGGGGIMVSIFTLFFNYSEKEAVLIVFVPVFGASLGNFLNLIKQVDPQSKEPIVNIRRAIVSCPIMIIGSITGILMNKFLSGTTFFIVAFLEYFIIKVLLKFIKQAMKETKIENERRRQQQNLLVQVELKDLSSEPKTDVLEKLLSNKEALITAFCIVGFILVGYLLRGARNFQSIIGIQYCGFGYWALTGGLIYAMYQAFQYVCDKFLENKSHKEEYMVQSFKAGIINGFGLGGGSFLVPLYISVGFSSIQSTGTSSFNILLTSFLAASQIIILGLININQAFQLFLLATIGCYVSSTIIFRELSIRDRLSVTMWSLVVFAAFACINLAIQFLRKWSAAGFSFSMLVDFQQIC